MISIVIPAHNEGSVIARTLKAITEGADSGELDLIVVCNGCTDNTAAVARTFGPLVRVVETKIASKSHALNLGDYEARAFPRVYADADIVITADAVRCLARRLKEGDVLAVAPTPTVDLDGCSWPVCSFYEVRSLLPSAKEGIGGSGVYALSEAGRRRFREFPSVTADDGYVRMQFSPGERETLDFVPSTVFPPKTIKALIATKTRAHYGSFELRYLFPQLWQNRGESNNKSLIRLAKNPRLWFKLGVYCFVTGVARHQARKRLRVGIATWERDETSRATA
jgi:glycosyltransferase involved in cell wall biosynthesis